MNAKKAHAFSVADLVIDSNAQYQSQMANSVKHHGRVYTPDWLVRTILDFGGYLGRGIVGRHVIDNSCGDGAFLREIVKRYCSQYNGDDVAYHLQSFIHGIELDREERDKCVANLDEVADRYGVKGVSWDIVCADALSVEIYNGKMDYVFGNPPYVRVHNLEANYDAVKKFSFAQQGMTDLFIVFFELGFRMMKTDGKMCIITPSSWLSSKAGSVLRQYIVQHSNLSGIIDLGHLQPFEATTYTAVSRFENNARTVELCRLSEIGAIPELIGNLSLVDVYITGNFYISDKRNLSELRSIRTGKAYKYVEVKNGFATLADKTFIGDFLFEEGTIDVLKASTGKWSKCIFPYDGKGKPLPPAMMQKNKPLYDYLLAHKEELAKERDVGNNELWYLFGRSQAIKDVTKDKYALNTIIKDKNSIRFEKVASGKGLYSGLYILTDIPENEIRRLIVSDDFVEYIRMLANYKSGGYYTFASKDLEQYLNYKLSQNMDNQEFLKVISNSFKTFLGTGSRSNENLKILHGAIASDMEMRLGKGLGFEVQLLGIGGGRECNIEGRYIDKKVDITILRKGIVTAEIGVKSVMQNYSQNSNNYFENMLGETANIRCASVPYFQVFIIPEKLPYYKDSGKFSKWEQFTQHNVQKYLRLSEDNVEMSIHTPTKTLLYVINLPELPEDPIDRNAYVQFYQSMPKIRVSTSRTQFGLFHPAVVFNDYDVFADKVAHYIKSI